MVGISPCKIFCCFHGVTVKIPTCATSKVNTKIAEKLWNSQQLSFLYQYSVKEINALFCTNMRSLLLFVGQSLAGLNTASFAYKCLL